MSSCGDEAEDSAPPTPGETGITEREQCMAQQEQEQEQEQEAPSGRLLSRHIGHLVSYAAVAAAPVLDLCGYTCTNSEHVKQRGRLSDGLSRFLDEFYDCLNNLRNPPSGAGAQDVHLFSRKYTSSVSRYLDVELASIYQCTYVDSPETCESGSIYVTQWQLQHLVVELLLKDKQTWEGYRQSIRDKSGDSERGHVRGDLANKMRAVVRRYTNLAMSGKYRNNAECYAEYKRTMLALVHRMQSCGITESVISSVTNGAIAASPDPETQQFLLSQCCCELGWVSTYVMTTAQDDLDKEGEYDGERECENQDKAYRVAESCAGLGDAEGMRVAVDRVMKCMDDSALDYTSETMPDLVRATLKRGNPACLSVLFDLDQIRPVDDYPVWEHISCPTVIDCLIAHGFAVKNALLEGHYDEYTVKRLIECGADVNAQAYQYGNHTPLSVANTAAVMDLLLASGANPLLTVDGNAYGKMDPSPHLLLNHGSSQREAFLSKIQLSAIKRTLDERMDSTAASAEFQKILDEALLVEVQEAYFAPRLVRLLLELGANPSKPNGNGVTAYQLMCSSKHNVAPADLMAAFIRSGAKS